MSIGGNSLGSVVLVLTTDATPLRQGLAQARTDTTRTAQQIKEAARVQFAVDLAKLKTDLGGATREMATARRLLEQNSRFDLAINLAQFRSDLKVAQQEQAAALKQMQQQAKQANSGGGLLGGFGGAVLQGAGIATGFGLVTQGVGAAIGGVKAFAGAAEEATSVAIEYNAAIEQSEARLRGYGATANQIAKDQDIANKAVAEGRGTYRETLAALADLTPLARTYNANLEDLLRTTQLLAATDPEQGFTGAAIALREALSGDFTSLQRRNPTTLPIAA